MKGYLLGIDNGGTVTKAAVFDTEGNEVAVATRKVEILQLFHGWNERDAEKMWKDTCEVIREVLSLSAIKSEQVLGVACTGHGNGLYLVDGNGMPVRNAINSTDTRAQKYVESWKKSGIDKLVLPYTTQSLWPGQPNAILAWLKEHEPESLNKAKFVLMAKDFIRMKLTGEFFAEITDMSGTSLMSVTKRSYDNHILRLFGLEEMEDVLPPLIDSSEPAGNVTQKAAVQTGLKAGTPVAGGMFDIDACALASGIADENQMSLVAGTWGNNQYIAKNPLIDKDLFMSSIYAIPGWYLMLEGSPTSAGNLDWFIDTFLQDEKKRHGSRFFEWLNKQVCSVSPESSGVIFLPFLYGNNTGKNIPATFYGLEGRHKRAHLIRAVYEGIVFSHRTHIERLLNFRNPPDVIRCTGGATQSEVWMQMFADAIGIPVEIPAGIQLGALGAAIAAAVCTGVYRDFNEGIQSMVRIEHIYEPNMIIHEIYQEKFYVYQNIIRSFPLKNNDLPT
ncbi:FGGY-family carbohydrate kinase [Maribellus maritimus]|uniref:FGGY-family carbohydrate kinase n=1 Tax=Maribellus maritimus TaxID=2870838 RepID=UPI001EEC1AFC|nr:FGGY-family carbohydrate kinase [Maribellus maritimus]MCG6189523.1 carbohydrate kinase [Maribellus maritimus]